MLKRLANGTQEVTWPGSVEAFWDFTESWGLIPDLAVRVLALGYYSRALYGLNLFITSGRRTEQRQLELQRQHPQWYANPRVASSQHLSGRAVDLGGDFRFSERQWEAIGVLGEQLGLRWGGRFSRPDPVHFDLPSTL